MLTIRAICAALLLAAISSSSLAQSQKPPAEIKGGELGADSGRTKPAPAVNFPTSKEITEAIANGIERADEKHETTHPALPPDNSGWYFNFFLVGFTGLLVVVGFANCWLIFWTLKATQTAANAAKSAAEVIPLVERPYVFVFGAYKFEAGSGEDAFLPFLRYKAANYGKTPAVVEAVIVSIGATDKGQPTRAMQVEGTHWLLRRPILTAGEKRNFRVSFPDGMDHDAGDTGEIVPRLKDTEEFFLRIEISYRGAFTKGHETSACWRRDDATNRFVQFGGAAYNYER